MFRFIDQPWGKGDAAGPRWHAGFQRQIDIIRSSDSPDRYAKISLYRDYDYNLRTNDVQHHGIHTSFTHQNGFYSVCLRVPNWIGQQLNLANKAPWWILEHLANHYHEEHPWLRVAQALVREAFAHSNTSQR